MDLVDKPYENTSRTKNIFYIRSVKFTLVYELDNYKVILILGYILFVTGITGPLFHNN